jgi:hypothetical protein
MQISKHLLNRLVAVPFGRVLFGQALRALDHPVGLGRIRQRRPVLDLLILAKHVEVVRRLDLRTPAVLETFERKALLGGTRARCPSRFW